MNKIQQLSRVDSILYNIFQWEMAVILGVCAIAAVLTFGLDMVAPVRTIGLVVMLPVTFIAWFAYRRGYTPAAHAVVIYGLWAAITLAIVPNGGIHAPATGGYYILILVSGWLLGRNHLRAITALSFLATIGLIAAEYADLLPAYSEPSPVWLLLVHCALFVIAAVAAQYVNHGFTQSLHDATQLNEKVAAQRRQYLGMLEAQSDAGIGVLMTEGNRVLYANDAIREMFGYTSADIAAEPTPPVARFMSLVHEEDRELVERNLENRLADEPFDRRFELRMQTKQGELRVVEVSAAVIQAVPLPRTLIMLLDITARKRAEIAREQLESQLRESQKMEALGTLAGGVAHDFNNALAVIIGNVELASQDVGPAHAAQVSLDEIGKASRRAKDLVQQILAFGRRQKLERKATSLALVVVESARLIRATLPALVSLNVDCRGDTPAVLADATAVKQILLNLCSNAVQAVQGQRRTGVIDVRLEAYAQAEARGDLRPGRYALLSVHDNGSGLDEATRARIFEPFFTTKPVGEGTGLGLAVVHGMVQEHEACIEVESAPGAGSTFRIYFPAVDTQVLDDAASVSCAASVDGKGKHILYVDDEEGLILLMQRLLERQGYRVSGYTDPREAIEAVRADPGQFDLVVTDYSMPNMSGLDVAIALKEIRADLPVVLASGYITEKLRAEAPAAGIRELIYKPNTVDDLCAAVARLANTQGTQATPS